MTYGEYIQSNRRHEREAFDLLTPTEQDERWKRREKWLWSYFLTLESRRIVVLSECLACHGAKPLAHSWPTFFECRCGVVFVLDKRSHLCPDDIERISIMNSRMLEIFADQNPTLLDPFGYPFADRIKDLGA